MCSRKPHDASRGSTQSRCIGLEIIYIFLLGAGFAAEMKVKDRLPCSVTGTSWHSLKIQCLWIVGGQGFSYRHQSIKANTDVYMLTANKEAWEQGRRTVMLFAVFIQFPTHKQHPALCSPLLLLREDVGWFLTFRCTPLPHKHSLMHRYACAA